MKDKSESGRKGAPGARRFLQAVTSAATWADLPLAESDREMLRSMAREVGDRATKPGPSSAASAQGRGVLAVFVTSDRASSLAATGVLANERKAPLYRVDLGAVAGKYIGETEKNLDAVFDEAQRSGGVLLFDEADALFGRHTNVRDAHDRYANLDAGAVLDRLNRFNGLAVVVTQRRELLDEAVLRRARCVVDLPPKQ